MKIKELKKESANPKLRKTIYHEAPIRLIHSLIEGRKLTLTTARSLLHKSPATLRWKEGKMTVTIKPTRVHPLELNVGNQPVSFTANTRPRAIVLHDIFLSQISNASAFGTVFQVKSKGFQEKRGYFYRLIMILDKRIDFHYILDERAYLSDVQGKSREGTIVKIGNETFTLCLFNDETKRRYLSIESDNKQSFKTFSEKAFAIRCALAFVSGRFLGGSVFYFGYTRPIMKVFNQFCVQEGRKSIHGRYQPLWTNPFAFDSIKRVEQKKWYKRRVLQPVSIESFSRLTEKLLKENEFRSVIFLLVTSMAADMEQLPGGLAIVLEMLPGILLDDLHVDLTPVKDASLRDRIVKRLKESLKEFESELTSEALSIFTSKVDNINQVANKTKLLAPFRQLGITLSKEDMTVINSRNNFLHGEIPDILKKGKDRPAARKTRDAYYCGVRLYTLINILILKWVGFEGYVLNHPVIQRRICQVPINEPPYLLVGSKRT